MLFASLGKLLLLWIPSIHTVSHRVRNEMTDDSSAEAPIPIALLLSIGNGHFSLKHGLLSFS